MKRNKRLIGAAGLVGAAMLLSACGYSVPSDMVAVHVGAGPFEASKVKGCIDPGKRKHWFQTNDSYHLLPGPTNQREWDATGQDGSDAVPFTAVTGDGVLMSIPVTVRFTIDSTSCEKVQQFYTNFVRRYGVSFDGKGKGNKEWDQLVRKLIADPTDTSLDRIVQGYKWREVWNDPKTKTEIERKLTEALNSEGSLVVQNAKGDYFDGFSVLIGQPAPARVELADAVALEQTNVAKAQSAEAQARADEAKARAQVAVAKAEAAKKRAEIEGYGSDDTYLRNKLIEQGGNPYQPSWGAPVGQTNVGQEPPK